MTDTSNTVITPAVPTPRKPRKAKANGVTHAAGLKARRVSKAATASARGRKAPVPKVGLDGFGFRKGSLKSQAAAMYASKKGATLDEIKARLNSIQLNLLTALEEDGFKITKLKEDGAGKRQITRYFLRAK